MSNDNLISRDEPEKRQMAPAPSGADLSQVAPVLGGYCGLTNHRWVSTATATILVCAVCGANWCEEVEIFLSWLEQHPL